MPEVFIVRPFGERPVMKKIKNSADTETVYFDFEKFENELTTPAMLDCGLSGGTTGEIFATGNFIDKRCCQKQEKSDALHNQFHYGKRSIWWAWVRFVKRKSFRNFKDNSEN